MNFDSYITSSTKTAFTVGVNQKLIKYNKFNLKKTAFTLAETLITLTIIGVIAALTIPTLISKYQKHTYVVGLKKAYSQLQNAVKMIPITQGCSPGDFDCAGWNDNKNIEGQEFENDNPDAAIANKRAYLLSKQFKINKLCYYGSTDEICRKAGNFVASHAYFFTNDGMIWNGYYYTVDVNGFKGPNKMGRDQFRFEITGQYEESQLGIPQGTVVPLGSKLYADMYNCPTCYWRNNNYCSAEINDYYYTRTGGWTCTGRVLEEDAMNY